MVQKTEEGYEIISGNFLHKKCANLLEARLRMINFLNEEQLDQIYRGVLSNERISNSRKPVLAYWMLFADPETLLIFRSML